MVDYFVTSIVTLGPWSYGVIFFIVVLECQLGLGLVLPGESTLLVAGFWVEQGLIDLSALLLVICLAASLGDTLNYQLGKNKGREWLVRYAGRLGRGKGHMDRVEVFFAKHGDKAVFSSHFLHLFRSLIPFVAGASRMPYRQFLACNVLGCCAWTSVFVFIGYLAGKGWRELAGGAGGMAMLLSGLLLVACFLIWVRRRRLGGHGARLTRLK